MRIGEITSASLFFLYKNLYFSLLSSLDISKKILSKPHKHPQAPLKHANVIFYPDNTLPFNELQKQSVNAYRTERGKLQ